MSKTGGVRHQLSVHKDRHENHRVRHMRYIASVGVIEEDHVALLDLLRAVVLRQMLGDGREGAKVERKLLRDRHSAKLGVKKSGTAVLGLAQNGRVSAVEEDHPHLPDDAGDLRVNKLQDNGIQLVCHIFSHLSSMITLPIRSTKASCPGWTAIVESICSMMAGPWM